MDENIEWGWDQESDLKPEAGEWNQWNGHSPELEFCEFAAHLISLLKPKLVLETGTGQGYITRRTVLHLPKDSKYVCFETNLEFAERIKRSAFIQRYKNVSVEHGTLDPVLASSADLTIIDSAGGLGRNKEISMWWDVAKDNSFVLIHDVSLRHPVVTTHYQHAEMVKHLGIPGVFLANPRGSFLGQKR